MVKLAAILAVPLALLATVASLGVVVVDVTEGGPDGQRIIVPAPLVLAQAALAVAPAVAGEELRLPTEDIPNVEIARDVLEALAEAPDGILVKVEEPGEQVEVRKEGDMIVVRVQSRNGEDVLVNAPLALAMSALPNAQGEVSTLAMAGSLSAVRFTDLVDVHDGDTHVRVWVW